MSAAAASGGGGDGPAQFKTDFAGSEGGGLIGLRAMIEHADPGTLDGISARWTAINKALLAAQTDLQSHTTAALGHWEGDAADGFATRAEQLYQALGNGAEYASNAGTGVSTAAAALRAAKQSMPSVPSKWDRFTRKVTSETNDQDFKQDLSSGMTRSQAIHQDGGELSLMEERHQQAIAVMETLETSYNGAAQMIGEGPRDSSGGREVWPPPPVTTKRSPVTGKDGAGVAGPGAGGGVRLVKDDETGSVGSTQALDPSRPSSESKAGDGGSDEGVSGGDHIPPPPEQTTTIQDVTPGVSGTGEGGGPGEGVTSTGTVHGLGDGGRTGSFGEGGIGGVSGGMSIGTGAGRGGVGVEGEGRFGKSDAMSAEGLTRAGGEVESGGFGESAGLSEGGILGADESGKAGTSEGFIEGRSETRGAGATSEGAEQGGPGMMGGAGGASKQGKKRKRRARAHYLVEDEESWASGVQANPPVIS